MLLLSPSILDLLLVLGLPLRFLLETFLFRLIRGLLRVLGGLLLQFSLRFFSVGSLDSLKSFESLETRLERQGTCLGL